MEVGMFTCGYQHYPLKRAFADAREMGYDYVELWGGRPHAFAPDLARGELKEVLECIQRTGVPVRVYTPEHNAYPYNYMAGSEAQWEDAMSYLKLCLDMGKAMGARYTLISVGHGGCTASRRELWQRLQKSLRLLADHAEAIGHTILLEALTAMESNLCTTAAEVCQILEEVNSPCLVGMCDTVAAAAARESPLDYYDRLGSRMAHLHLVDFDGTSETHLLPGEGVLPLGQLLRELERRGYDGGATIELVTAYLAQPALYAREALERVRKMLG